MVFKKGSKSIGAENMIYVTSDIHGRLDRLKKLIEKINLSKEDTLYIIGDLVDRGDQPIETIEYVMDHPNIEVLMGNHDEMMLYSLKYKDEVQIERWSRNGCHPTIEGFNKRNEEEKEKILNYIESLPYYKILDNKYLLIHAGFEAERLFENMKDKSLEESIEEQKDRVVWVRELFVEHKALDNLITIFGHTSRPKIDKILGQKTSIPYEIWFDPIHKDKIGIDTWNCNENGRMSCLRLDDFREFYIE